MPGPSEWVIIAIVAIVVIFGAKKIPEIARSMGRAQNEFKKGMKEGADDVQETPATQSPPQAPAQSQAQPQAPPAQAAQPEPPAQSPSGQADGQGSG
jgi:sec-independent protein translocase protein TatA